MKTKITKTQLNKFNYWYNNYLYLNNNNINIKWCRTNVLFLFKYNIILHNLTKPIHILAKNGYINLLELLIEKYKANVNIKDKECWTPLIYACNNDHIEMVKLLLQYCANVNIKNNKGATCFDFTNNKEIIELLNKYK